MPIHIGSLIQQEVERRRLTYKEFGALIHRNEKTVPDIYDRESMSTDLLLTISGALKVDLLSLYYTEEPLKSLRNDEVGYLNGQIERYKEQIQMLTEEIRLLQKELSLIRDLNRAQVEIISFAKEKIEDLKYKLSEATADKNC
ncbi:hypothetical protein [Niastella populi]|uniref:Uncharacterized protein n=1 Tax=Niastella populi TaxID=550983 RepID=A0A1V9GBJ5_9BACT|nr:hypothetical protein [Niastella populi]OQP67806.1 hypothetical protein A4R26_32785 [Niastella populi]